MRAGLIPAHAGKTPSGPPPSSARAHPRSRGENEAGDEKGSTFEGSSPLTRGKPVLGTGTALAHGLIPAHAGKTNPLGPRHSLRRAHPRSRGENTLIRADDKKFEGSSPLTRGKPAGQALAVSALGLIPAHAGKTGTGIGGIGRPWAHPRSRGENVGRVRRTGQLRGSSPLTRGKPGGHGAPDFRRRLIPAHAGKTSHHGAHGGGVAGSSPLTRGKRACHLNAGVKVGLIPAHAGKTVVIPTSGRRRWAHPRSRGENLWALTASRVLAGSSPLTRGKRRAQRWAALTAGLIPAHAGKTGCVCALLHVSEAHPRSRGENDERRLGEVGDFGSSPLTRGKRRAWFPFPVGWGLIPAHAGKTPRRRG